MELSKEQQEEIRDIVMAYPQGCDDGKKAFLRDALGIEPKARQFVEYTIRLERDEIYTGRPPRIGTRLTEAIKDLIYKEYQKAKPGDPRFGPAIMDANVRVFIHMGIVGS